GVHHETEWVLMGVSVGLAVLGIVGAFILYSDLRRAERLRTKLGAFYRVLSNKWYVDEFYDAAIVKPLGALSQLLWKFFDVKVIDRIVLSFGTASQQMGS